MIKNYISCSKQDAGLLATTNEVDYDQDAYAMQLELIINEKMEALAALRDKTRAFRDVHRLFTLNLFFLI